MSTMQQLTLPFGCEFREERASLVRAIRLSGLRAAEETFITYVHDVSRDSELRRTYNEIADRVNCSRRTAIRMVQRCVNAGLLVVGVESYRSGGQRENAYAINWDGVRALVFNGDPAPPPQVTRGVTPQCQSVTGECQGDTPQCQSVTPYKEQEPLLDPPIEPPPPEKPKGGGGFAEWGEIRTRLRALGMHDALGAIKIAQADGMTASDIAAIIDQWEAARPAWDLGALHWRCTRGSWPEHAAKARSREQAQRRFCETQEILVQCGPRARADPDDVPLAVQLRQRIYDQEGIT